MSLSKYEQIQAGLLTIKVLADAVKEAGPLGIGVGSLFGVCCQVTSLDTFERSLGLLTASGLVKREAGRLMWVGPVQRRD